MVPDDVWNEAAKYFDERQLASIVRASSQLEVMR